MNWLKSNSAAPQTPAGIGTVLLALQSLEMDPLLKPVFASHLETHAAYLCSKHSPTDYQGQIKIMQDAFKRAKCGSAPVCG